MTACQSYQAATHARGPSNTAPRAGGASLLMLCFSDNRVRGDYRSLAMMSFFPERELTAACSFSLLRAGIGVLVTLN